MVFKVVESPAKKRPDTYSPAKAVCMVSGVHDYNDRNEFDFPECASCVG